jgi:hypothetical protein
MKRAQGTDRQQFGIQSGARQANIRLFLTHIFMSVLKKPAHLLPGTNKPGTTFTTQMQLFGFFRLVYHIYLIFTNKRYTIRFSS